MAYKSDKVTRVAPVFYVETALSMVLDIVLFKINFSALQLTGLILVLGMFVIIIVYAYIREYKEPIEEAKGSKEQALQERKEVEEVTEEAKGKSN